LPNPTEHKTKAEHNEFLVSTLQNPFWDWAVIAIFYAALQYVEAYLSKKVPAVHSPNHAARDSHVQNDASLRTIYVDYRELKTESRDARYDAAITFSQSDVKRLQQNLDKIKRVIVPLL
jgi:hypothetical protein